MLAGHPVPEQEARALPSNPAPTVRKPILAYAICGAVLLVPLALSAPQRAPGGTEVVLATGSDEATVTAEAAGPAVDFAEAEIDAGADLDADADIDADVEVDVEADVDVGHGPTAHDQGEGGPPQPTSRRSGARSAPTSKRSGVSGTAAATATATGTATTPRPAEASAPTPAAAKASAPAPSADPPPPPPPPPAPAPPPPKPPSPPAPTAASSAWDRLAQCESGNTNDPGAPYYGYWQFSAATWHSVGETGLPDEYSRQHQLAAAMRLHAVRGWAPWPDCARRLGLR